MAIKKTELCWIVTVDVKKSRKFFTDTLGLKLNVNDEEHSWLELTGKEGGAMLGVCGPFFNEKPGQNAVPVFTVDDIIKTKKELEAKGVKFVGDIMELQDVKLATFVDPDGNKFQLAENIKK